MRFRINFTLEGEAPFALPASYHSDFSNWIHKMLHFGSDKFNKWLKKKGYTDSSGEYRMYTFSDVVFSGHRNQNDKVIIEGNTAEIILSFYADPAIEPLLYPIFEKQEFKVGDMTGKVAFKVENFEKIPEPELSKGGSYTFSCLSPMLISENTTVDGPFHAPDQKDFDKIFFKSLMFKYAKLVKFMAIEPGKGLPNLKELEFKLIGKPKPKIVKIKSDGPHQKSVKGFLFDFKLKAPEELLRIGYCGGFGEFNHLGFGCCKIKS